MMQTVTTRVRDDAHEFPTFDRGAHFLNVMEKLGITVYGQRIADLGTGFGSLAIASAKAGASSVLAVDANGDRILEVTRRIGDLRLPVEAIQANLLEPLVGFRADTVQVAFLIGVVEYAGLWQLDQPVDVLQRRVLEHSYQILEPGGLLVMATKNRLWPPYALRDLHTGQPLVNALPRRLADRLSRNLNGTPYREHIYSPKGWIQLLNAVGFRKVTCYYPIFGYQFPLMVVEKPDLRNVRQLTACTAVLPDEIAAVAAGHFPAAKAILMALSAAAHVPLSSSLIIKAEK